MRIVVFPLQFLVCTIFPSVKNEAFQYIATLDREVRIVRSNCEGQGN